MVTRAFRIAVMLPAITVGVFALAPLATADASPVELFDSTPTAGAVLGGSVAVNANDTEIIAGADSGSAGNAGAVDVFTNASGTWSQTAQLTSSDSGDGNVFGQSVALSSDGTIAIVAAPGAQWGSSAADVGEVDVFLDSSGTWTQIATIDSPGTSSNPGSFGESVAASSDGSVIAIGDPAAGSDFQGAVYTYINNGSSYVSAGSFTGPVASAQLGTRVAVSGSGNEAAAGEPDYEQNYVANPQVLTFSSDGSTFSSQSDISTPGTDPYDSFGGGALSFNSAGTSLLVGVPDLSTYQSETVTGGAYLLNYASGTWSEDTLFTTTAGPDTYCALGYSGVLAPTGDAVLLGEPFCNALSTSAGGGIADEWLESGSSWPSSPTVISASDTGDEDTFGWSVALPSNYLSDPVIGAPQHTVDLVSKAGAVYAF